MSEKCNICGHEMDLGDDNVWYCSYCGNDTANVVDSTIPIVEPPKKDKKGGWW